MDFGMAVHAITTEQRSIGHTTRQSSAAVQITGVKLGNVTVLTQERRPGVEQRLMNRTMGYVTAAAVLTGWRMFEQERSALIFMAPEAGIVQIKANQLTLIK